MTIAVSAARRTVDVVFRAQTFGKQLHADPAGTQGGQGENGNGEFVEEVHDASGANDPTSISFYFLLPRVLLLQVQVSPSAVEYTCQTVHEGLF